MKLRHIILSLLASASVCAQAQTEAEVEPLDSAALPHTIVESINEAHGSVTVVQPMELDRITGRFDSKGANAQSKRGMGYRIQVFSDNNTRTAKANAEYRKRTIQAQMPELRAYLTFESPYWRVRVGDFRSQSEAAAAMRQLKEAFPAFANDFRLVRERINSQHPQ